MIARQFVATIISVFFIINGAVAFAQSPGIDGFSAQTSGAERRLEEQFRAVPSPNSAREHTVRVAMNNAYAFGGNNASLVLRKHE